MGGFPGQTLPVVTVMAAWPRPRSIRKIGRPGAPKRPGRPGGGLIISSGYFTRLLSLKIGRMMLIAMKPTMLPIRTIINGSIIEVTVLITLLSSPA